MPTKYRPIVNHIRLNDENLERIVDRVKSCREKLVTLLFETGTSWEEDDIDPLADDITSILLKFAFRCSALPLRSPNQLVGTLKFIARKPNEFGLNIDSYDPEAVACVLAAYGHGSAVDRHNVLLFEIGQGPGLSAPQIAEAARASIKELQGKKSTSLRRYGGRTRDELQTALAIDLAMVFVGQGGSLARIVDDGETGPFHRFLNLLLPIVRSYAREAGSSLTINTMVRKAQEALAANGH